MSVQPVQKWRIGRWPVLVAAGLAFIVLIGLGTWQVQRLAWKEGLIATMQQRIAQPPIELVAGLKADPDLSHEEYRPVRVAGTFEHAFERHFFATHNGDTGFYVYTPLKLDDGDWLFVNRGFVPYEKKDPATRAEGQVTGRVEIIGLLRAALAEKPSSMVPDNDPAKNIFYWKDIRAMAASSGLPSDAPVLGLFVDANDAPNTGGLPVGGVTIVDLPNNHLQYAVTWYGLAAALVGVVGVWLARSYRMQRQYEAVKRLLWEEWDPIGVRSLGGPDDEYDSYALEVWAMIQRSAPAPEIATYLADLETGRIGLSEKSGRAGRVAELVTATR